MNQAYLKNILSTKFDFDIWKDLLEKIFPKVEVFTSVAKIADSHVKDGGHVGNPPLPNSRVQNPAPLKIRWRRKDSCLKTSAAI